jgi:hypothetical protein
MIDAGRRDIAGAGGRDPPIEARHAIDINGHALAAAVDMNDYRGLGAGHEKN